MEGTTYYIADVAPIAYSVVSADADGGYARIHRKYYLAGDTVEADAVPYAGYVAASFVAGDAAGNETPITGDTFVMPAFNVTLVATFGLDIAECSVSGINESYTYTGSAITPAVTVKSGDTALTQDVDYVVSYESNVNVGTAFVVIAGKGGYAGTASMSFAIMPAPDPTVHEGGEIPATSDASAPLPGAALCLALVACGTMVAASRRGCR